MQAGEAARQRLVPDVQGAIGSGESSQSFPPPYPTRASPMGFEACAVRGKAAAGAAPPAKCKCVLAHRSARMWVQCRQLRDVAGKCGA